MKLSLRHARPLDFVALLVSLGMIAVFSLYSHHGRTGVLQVEIHTPGQVSLYTLAEDRTVEVEGPLGITVVQIAGARARVLESPCRDKLCVQQGPISSPATWIACLPNQVMLRLIGQQRETIDAHSH